MSLDLAFSSAKWKPRKNRLPKMPQDAFSVGVRYHAFGNPATITRVKLERQ
jgi:hypothetical protein